MIDNSADVFAKDDSDDGSRTRVQDPQCHPAVEVRDDRAIRISKVCLRAAINWYSSALCMAVSFWADYIAKILTSSAKEEAPVQASSPDPSHTKSEAPTLPQCAVTIPCMTVASSDSTLATAREGTHERYAPVH